MIDLVPCVVMPGSLTLQAFGIEVYDTLQECARKRGMVSVKRVETANSEACRRVSVSIEALQHNDMFVAYFQETVTKGLDHLDCEIWVHDIVWWGQTPEKLVEIMNVMLGRREDFSLVAECTNVRFSTLVSSDVL